MQSYFVETIGNANEDTIHKDVQNQLVEQPSKWGASLKDTALRYEPCFFMTLND